MKDDEYAGVWEEHMRRNAAKKDYGEEKQTWGKDRPAMSLPFHPPNLQPEDIPDDPISPAFDPVLIANSWDKHNNYPRDHKFDDGSWNRAPQPPPAPPLHIPKTHKEMKEYYPFKNDQVGEYEAAAGISIDMLRHEDLRLAMERKEDEERWTKHCQYMASTYLANGQPIKEWGERCGIWTCCEPTEAEEGMGQLIAGERAMFGHPRPHPQCNLGLKSEEEAEAEQERRRIWRKNNWSEEPNGE